MNFADRASELALSGRARRNAAFARRRRFRRRFALQERHYLIASGFRFVRRAHLLDGVRNAHQHRPLNAFANPFEKIKIHRFPLLGIVASRSTRRAPSRFFSPNESKFSSFIRSTRRFHRFFTRKRRKNFPLIRNVPFNRFIRLRLARQNRASFRRRSPELFLASNAFPFQFSNFIF